MGFAARCVVNLFIVFLVFAVLLFVDVDVVHLDWEIVYDADSYIALLDTFSGHIALDREQRNHLDAEIRRRLTDRPDGLLRRHWGAALRLARRG